MARRGGQRSAGGQGHGQGGAGEILPLMHVMETVDADDLVEGEGMALLNGSPCATALVADVALHAGHRLRLAEARAARDAFDGCAPWRARAGAAEIEAAVARLVAESAAEVAAREAEGLDPSQQRPGVPDGVGAAWPGGGP